MALNFPDSPSLNQVYTDTTSGFSYQWDGVVWKSFAPASSSQIRIIDDISGSFNGSTQIFSLAVLGDPLIPANAQQLRVVLGGIVQEPEVDYTVSGSNITFTTFPTGGLDCSIVSLGPAVPIGTVGDGTVTPIKLSTGGPSWNSGGDVVITGTGSTSLFVNGNVRVTGVVTATSFVGNLTGTASTATNAGYASTAGYATTSFGLEGTPNLNVGVITATTYYGDGSQLQNIISGVGIATAGGYVGSGATTIDFRGAGISTVTVSSGIATVNIEGGGGGGGFSATNYIFN